jgi:ABC-type multidrug transport system fused ATPase/permease subunit
MLKKLNFLLSKKERRVLLLLLFMSLFLSVIEVVGIGAIMPFIAMATNPDLIAENKYLKYIYNLFQIDSEQSFIIYFGVLLIIFYVFRALYTVFHGYMINKFSMGKYLTLTNKLFSAYLSMPYIIFVNKNSASLSKAIITEAGQLAFIFRSVLTIISEVLVIVVMYILLLIVDIEMTIVLTIILGLQVLLLKFTISEIIKKQGLKREYLQGKLYRKINEFVGNFKVIKFTSNQDSLLQSFSRNGVKYRKVHIIINTLKLIPRALLEAVGLSIIIGVIVYIIAFHSNPSSIIPIISMYALALYRSLPAISRIIDNYNDVLFHSSSIDVVYRELVQAYEPDLNSVICFNKSIRVENVTFSYDKKIKVIDNLSLTINKGDRVAFVGSSGSGKSTIVDVICGIYRPNSGRVLIDNQELDSSNIAFWRGEIGYIPQSIYLFDGTIAQNVVFGREYNELKLINALKQASIYNFILKKDGLNTMVGEGGIQVSGGQKQRIGIARALYGDPKILVLDEATSALDSATEEVIMDEIYKVSKDKTLIIIAHRLSTIERCDVKIDLNEVV